jgi:hypothetical protein
MRARWRLVWDDKGRLGQDWIRTGDLFRVKSKQSRSPLILHRTDDSERAQKQPK